MSDNRRVIHIGDIVATSTDRRAVLRDIITPQDGNAQYAKVIVQHIDEQTDQLPDILSVRHPSYIKCVWINDRLLLDNNYKLEF